MNERIKELAHEADLIIKKSNGNDFRFGTMNPKLEKFAELIVQECILSIYRSDISNKKQERLVEELVYKFGFGVEE